jgi:uncharacterized protein (TIGR00369 family)
MEKIQKQIQDIAHHMTEQELQLLEQLLKSFQLWKAGKSTTFISSLLQMERRITDDDCEITIPISPLLYNTLDIVHGGITATLLDTAMGVLANSLISEGYGAVTTQLNINYIAAGIGEKMICRAKMEHKGSKTLVLSAEIHRSDGVKIAMGTGSFLVIEKRI